MLRAIRAPRHVGVFLLVLVVMSASAAHGQTTTFTYQGQLSDAGALANASYDLQFALFDTAAGGAPIGGANQTVPAVPVSNGVFTVQLDFGLDAFPGANRFVEIGVRPAGVGSFTTLAPRQQISSSPYAIRTLSAAKADALSSACVGCVTNAQIQGVAGSKVSGAIPAASVPTGSGNYIQNTTMQQASASFNIAGSGTSGSMNVNGAVSLGGISPPAPAPAGQGRIYFDTSSNKVKVSENGAAFVNLTGASGVSGSGTTNTIPLWSAGTTLGNSLITQSGLSVQLPNNVSLAVGAQGNAVAFGSPNGETGMTISGTTGRSDLRFDGTTLKLIAGPAGGPPAATNGVAVTTAGFVGIGIENPAIGKLHVVGAPGVPAIYGESANRGVWGHSTGASRGVYGDSVSGEGVHGESTSGTGVAGLTASANIASPGVGGASTGNGGVGVRGDGTTGVYGRSTSAGGIGVSGESNGGNAVYGISHNPDSGAVAGVNDLGGIGVYGESHGGFNTGFAMWADGDAKQTRDRGGWAKAMAFVRADGSILRCYNSQVVPHATGDCGISVDHSGGAGGVGEYLVNFGFNVADRFVNATAVDSQNSGRTLVLIPQNNANVWRVSIEEENSDNNLFTHDSDFMIIVF